ncbi:MAG: Rieske (2Fe-2S) protein [Anaerolineae bacterium]
MNWIKVLPETELPEGTRQVVNVQDHSILLIHENGKVYAMLSACPHMRLPLKGGEITEDEIGSSAAIVCPFHHSAFDLQTGDVKAWSTWPPVVGKMLGSISREKALRVFPTRIAEGSIWIDLD